MNTNTPVDDGREQIYGEPVENCRRIAQVWSGILGHEVRPDQVPLMMVGFKAVRTSVTPEYSDNIDDLEGYGELFRRVMGDSIIQARSTAEFIEKRYGAREPEPEPDPEDRRPKTTPDTPGTGRGSYSLPEGTEKPYCQHAGCMNLAHRMLILKDDQSHVCCNLHWTSGEATK